MARKKSRVSLPHIAAGLFLLLALVAAFFLIKEIAGRRKSAGPGNATYRSIEETEWGSKLKLNGQSYTQKDGLTTVLLLGIDDSKTPDPLVLGDWYRSDALVLLILNDKTQTMQTLSISRDTITEVDMYDNKGDYIHSADMQINMQYAFGDSHRRSQYLTKKTVSELIHGRRIDACLSVTMSGLPTIGEIMGGLTLTMNEDYTYIDPRYEKGAVLTLGGEELERFIRYRDIEEQGSNEKRVARQEWLMQQLFDSFGTGSRSSLAERVLDEAGDYIFTDLDADTIGKISKYTLVPESLKIPGTSGAGDYHDEFTVDEEALQELLLTIFYDPA